MRFIAGPRATEDVWVLRGQGQGWWRLWSLLLVNLRINLLGITILGKVQISGNGIVTS